jgi:guanosine-3',5'-bis(diphosphate) 3'-pyrophosphohydrolase
MPYREVSMNVGVLLAAIQFSATKHRDQRRKGADASPYINHPIEVAALLANVAGVQDDAILTAAVLHDTVEDTCTTPTEIESMFGTAVRSLVLEVTDDKSQPKPERKRLQIEHAPHLSPAAKHIKIADKISNVQGVTDCPPIDWPLARRREYLDWAERVVAGCRGVNSALESRFDDTLRCAREVISKET